MPEDSALPRFLLPEESFAESVRSRQKAGVLIVVRKLFDRARRLSGRRELLEGLGLLLVGPCGHRLRSLSIHRMILAMP